MRWNEGFANTKLVALLLSGALAVAPGVTALASGEIGEEPVEMEFVQVPDAEIDSEPEEVYDGPMVEEAPVEDYGIEEPQDEYEEAVDEVPFPDDEMEPAADEPQEPLEQEPAEDEPLDEVSEDEALSLVEEEAPAEEEDAQPDETVDIDLFFEQRLANVATELAALTREDRDALIDVWSRNNFSYDPQDDMLSEYKYIQNADGSFREILNDEAALVVMMFNFKACLNYVDSYFYPGYEYWEAYKDAAESSFLHMMEAVDFDSLLLIGSSLYDKARAIEAAEELVNEESQIMRLFNDYPYAQGVQDATDFFAAIDSVR